MLRQIVDALVRDNSDRLVIQLFRYGIVGGISFVVDFGTLYLLTEFAGMPYLVSASLGFCVGLATNWLLSVQWVFQRTDATRNKQAEFIGWLLSGLAGLGLNALIMWLFTDILSFFYLFSKIVSTIVVFFWNFFSRRSLISKI